MKAHPCLSVENIPTEMITLGGDFVDSKRTIRAVQSQRLRIVLTRGIKKLRIETLV